MGFRGWDRFNRANGAPGSTPTGRTALVVRQSAGSHEDAVAASHGWTVTTIDTTTGGVWPSRAAIAAYDLLVIDASYNGIDATGQTNAANAYTDGVNVYTTGNDTTAMSPLFTGVASDNGYDSTQYPNGTHALTAGWTAFGDGDLTYYLTGVNASAITFMTTQIAAGNYQPTGVAMQNTVTGARWVHVEPYSSVHPAGLDATVYGWLSETKWQKARAWEALSGSATISNNELLFSTSGTLNPMYTLDVGWRMNDDNDVDVSMTPRHVYGNALYVRVSDANNWIRARVASYQTSYQYYNTETLWNDNRWYDQYNTGTLQREVRTTNTNTTWTYGAWSGWSNTGEQTACRDSAPTYGLNPVVGQSGTQNVTEYRWVSNGDGVGCAAGRATYRKQSRSRTETQGTSTSYSYRWVNDGYTLGANENFTGSTQVVYSGGYGKYSTSTSTTNPGQTTTKNGTYDQYLSTSLVGYSTYWSSYRNDANDTATTSPATTRQTGPYTGYNQYYGQVTLEKCVSGTITTLGSYLSDSTAQQVVRLRAKGSTLQVYYGGTLQITATDSHNITGWRIGVGGGESTYNQTNARIDDFSYVLLTPYRIRNSGGTAWLDCERPRIRNAANTAWLDYDPKKYASGGGI